MSTTGYIGAKTKCGFSTTENGTYTYFIQLFKINMAGITTAKVKYTNFDSPLDTAGNPVHEYGPGWGDPQPITYDAVYSASDREVVHQQRAKLQWFKLLYPDNSYDKVYGYIADIKGEVPLEDKLTSSVTIQPSGPIEFFKASGSEIID